MQRVHGVVCSVGLEERGWICDQVMAEGRK